MQFQRRYIQARYDAALRIFSDGASLANTLASHYNKYVRQPDGALWKFANDNDFRSVAFAQTQTEFNWEQQDDTMAFAKEAQQVFDNVSSGLGISSYNRLGLVQNVLVPYKDFEQCKNAIIENIYNNKLTSNRNPLKWKPSDVGITLDFRDEHWCGQIRFGPYNAGVNAQFFEFQDAPRLLAFVDGFIFCCDFWRVHQYNPSEVSKFAKEATELTTNAIQDFMGILGGSQK